MTCWKEVRVFKGGNALIPNNCIQLSAQLTIRVRLRPQPNPQQQAVIDEANKHTYSRFPVVSPRGERVVGIISLFDLLGLDGGEKLGSVMQSPLFAHEGESAEKLLLMMKEEALHMAVVEGDGKQALGIVTLEDLLENIVGDITSEYE